MANKNQWLDEQNHYLLGLLDKVTIRVKALGVGFKPLPYLVRDIGHQIHLFAVLCSACHARPTHPPILLCVPGRIGCFHGSDHLRMWSEWSDPDYVWGVFPPVLDHSGRISKPGGNIVSMSRPRNTLTEGIRGWPLYVWLWYIVSFCFPGWL